MISQLINKAQRLLSGSLREEIRFNRKLCQGTAGASLRAIDSTNPRTWEFSGFSQNGEDGIIEYLCRKLRNPNKYFIEIGASDGLENNSAWLATVLKYAGLMIEGNSKALNAAKKLYHGPGVVYLDLFVKKENVSTLKSAAMHSDPDFFSIDIDGMDFYLMSTILDAGIRPKVICVEYNSAFGPDHSLTIPYSENFIHDANVDRGYLYYGVSCKGWKTFFHSRNYKFVTVDSNGVNAFFVDPSEFDDEFLSQICGTEFKENSYQLKLYGNTWQHQYTMIQGREFSRIR